jgi:hypothetical protein
MKTLRNIIIALFLGLFVSSAFSALPSCWLMPDVQTRTEKNVTVTFDNAKNTAFLRLYYEGRSLTKEYKTYSGIVFSAKPVTLFGNPAIYDGDTPANEVIEGKIYNPWVISFSGRKTTFVEVALLDKSDNTGVGPLWHFVYFFDNTGAVVSSAGYYDEGVVPGPMTMSFDTSIYKSTKPNMAISKVLIRSEPVNAGVVIPFADRQLSVKEIVYRYTTLPY